jgi:SAM-dependent methyltransferase
MGETEGARSFQASGDAYDRFMGRYSRPLAIAFADAAGVESAMAVLDVGCGPGALTGELVTRLEPGHVSAFDPSPPFVAECRVRHPGVDVRPGRVESIPFDDDTFDCALAQLVLHFVTDPELAAREMRRVVRPGGTIGACVWDFSEGMEMLRRFWDAALIVDPDAPDEARTLRFGRQGEIAELFEAADLHDIVETTLQVSSTYEDFDELWSGFLAGIGPAGTYCTSLPEERRVALRAELFTSIGRPSGSVTMPAVARCVTARRP